MSKIEWTGETWNAIVGCSVVSPGCTNCYAMRMASRLEAMAGDGLDDNGYAVRGKGPLDHYRGLTRPSRAGPVWTGKVALSEDALLKPLKRRKPTTYFVNSMSDLFHEDVPDEWILRVLDVIRRASYDGGSNIGTIDHGEGEHTFQCLTKRSARMLSVMSRLRWDGNRLHLLEKNDGRARVLLRNLWLGVSCEDQRRADERIPDLLATPAAVRFVSAEPLLGPVHIAKFLACTGMPDCEVCEAGGRRLDWIIVGGESGPRAREFKLGWASDIVRQCLQAGVAVFVKQIGSRPTYCRDGIELPVSIRDRKGGDMSEWPDDLCVRQMPSNQQVEAAA